MASSRVSRGASTVDDVGASIERWQADTVVRKDHETGTGPIGSLFNSLVELLGLVLIDIKTKPAMSQHYQSLESSSAALFFWGTDLGVSRGELDEVLQDSTQLRDTCLLVLVSIGQFLVSAFVRLLSSKDRHKEILDSTGIVPVLEQAMNILDQQDYPTHQPEQNEEALCRTLRMKIDTLLMLSSSLASPADEDFDDEEPRVFDDGEEHLPEQAYINSVAQRFPLAASTVVSHLGKLNWERYNHMLRLQRDATQQELEVAVMEKARTIFHDSALGSSMPAQSEAGLDTSGIPSQPQSVYAPSMVSSRAEASHKRLPPLPPQARSGQPFTCAICNKQVRYQRTKAWKKHIFNDILAYSCFFNECSAANIFFEDHHAMMSHLEQHHGLDVSISTVTCPLCLDYTSDDRDTLSLHFARHMEEIALAIIPSGVDSDDESAYETPSEAGTQLEERRSEDEQFAGETVTTHDFDKVSYTGAVFDEPIFEEDEVTRCVCGHQEFPGLPYDDGESSPETRDDDLDGMFIQCDECKVWQHGGCVGILDEAASPDEYFCPECRADLHTVVTNSKGQTYSHYLPVDNTRKTRRRREHNRAFLPQTPLLNEKIETTELPPPDTNRRSDPFLYDDTALKNFDFDSFLHDPTKYEVEDFDFHGITEVGGEEQVTNGKPGQVDGDAQQVSDLIREAQRRAQLAAHSNQPLTAQVRMSMLPPDLDPGVQAQLLKVPEQQFRAILQQYMQNQSNMKVGGKEQVTNVRSGPSSYWSVAELRGFEENIARFGTNWEAIADHMGTKSPTMVKNQYRRVLEGGRTDLEELALDANMRTEIKRLMHTNEEKESRLRQLEQAIAVLQRSRDLGSERIGETNMQEKSFYRPASPSPAPWNQNETPTAMLQQLQQENEKKDSKLRQLERAVMALQQQSQFSKSTPFPPASASKSGQPEPPTPQQQPQNYAPVITLRPGEQVLGTGPQPAINQHHLPGTQQQRLTAAQHMLQQNPGIINATDAKPYPPNVLSRQIRANVPLDVKSWGQLKQWATQNPALIPGVSMEKLVLLQALHFQDLLRQQNRVAPIQQVPPQNNMSFDAPPPQSTPAPQNEEESSERGKSAVVTVRRDRNQVPWIAFGYSRDRVTMEYTIRCDINSVAVDELSYEFKIDNCLFPLAYQKPAADGIYRPPNEYADNMISWALALLNPCLRGKRDLLERAVESYRKSGIVSQSSGRDGG